jgi:hypothetical protein
LLVLVYADSVSLSLDEKVWAHCCSRSTRL